jgi:hypothetical protein
LICSIALHFFAGIIAGSAFGVRTLLFLVGIIFLESIVLSFVLGLTAGLVSLASLIVIQLGYVGGIFARSTLEQAGLSWPRGRTRRFREIEHLNPVAE